MPRNHARILTAIWSDDDWRALSPAAQRLYLLILSQPGLSFCGVTAYTPRRWAGMAAGDTLETVQQAVDELQAARYVVVDSDAEELWVRTFIAHDGILDGGPNLHKAMWRDLALISSASIRADLLASIPTDHEAWNTLPEGVTRPSPRPAGIPSRTPSATPSRRGFIRPLPTGSPTPCRTPSPTPTPTPTPKEHPPVELATTTNGARVGPSPMATEGTDPIVVVFDAWKEAIGRPRSVLDRKRRELIRRALKTHPPADLIDAVRGWRHSPHHRGENERSTVYNDLELLLRDAAHIEKFRDLERDGPSVVVSAPKGAGAITRMVQRAGGM